MKEDSGNIKVRGSKGVKRWLSYIVTLSMLMSLIVIPQIEVSAVAYTGSYSGGSGTSASPYLLSTSTDITNFLLDERSGKYYSVTNDITVSGTVTSPKASFDGVFDGNGHVINININKSDNTDHGFASFIIDLTGTIKNLQIDGVITDSDYAAGAAFASYVKSGGQILNCTSNATVNCDYYAAGIAMYLYDGGLIKGCGNIGTVGTTYTTECSGIVHYMNGGTIDSCYNRGTLIEVEGQSVHTSGIASAMTGGTISYCYNTATVDSAVVDYKSGGTITSCYSTNGSTTNGGTITTDADLKSSTSSVFTSLNGSGLYVINPSKNDGYPYTIPYFITTITPSGSKDYYSGAYRIAAGTYNNVRMDFDGDVVIYIASGDTVTITNDDGISPLSFGTGTIRLIVDGTLNASITKPNENSEDGGDACIDISPTSTSYIGGSGTINVTGQAGSEPDDSDCGGGGGGAGIGSEASAGTYGDYDGFDAYNYGKIYITDSITVKATGGAGGHSDNDNGSKGYGIGSGGVGGLGSGRFDIPGPVDGSYGTGKIYISNSANITGTVQTDCATYGTYTMLSLPSTVPSKPTGLSASSSRPSDLSLSWNAVSGAGNYKVYYKKSTDSAYSTKETTDTSCELFNPSAGTAYNVYVTASNAAGESTASSTITASTRCSEPTISSCTVAGGGKITVSWGAVTGATSYRVYYGVTSSPTTYYETTATSYTVANLPSGTNYFRVSAINSAGESDKSTTKSATVYADLSYADKTLSGMYSSSISQSVTGASGGSGSYNYTLYSGSLPSGLSLSTSGQLTGTLTAAPGTYAFVVKATDKSYPALTATASVSYTVSSDEPNDPTNFNAVRQSDGSILCTWSATTYDGDGQGNVTYRIFGADSTITVPTKNATSYTIPASSLTMGQSYTLKVDCMNSSGEVSPAYSNEVTVIPYVDMAYANKTLTAGKVGKAYSQSVATATGGYGTTTYALKSGQTLPAGLSLATNGTISGTPTTAVTNKTFVVVAKNSAGSKEATMTLTINKGDSSIVTTPTGKTLTYTGSAQSLATEGTASGGKMYYSLSSSASGTWSITIPTATAAGTYKVYYRVIGDSNYNGIAASESNCVTTTINPTNPSAPTNVKATRNSDGTVSVSWTASASDGNGLGGLTYTVYYGTSQTSLTSSLTATTGTSATTPVLTAGTTYYFKVTATNSSSKSTDSAIVDVVPYKDITYIAPTLTAATYNTSYSTSVATAANGYGTTTYALATDSTLPDGLSLAEDGTLSGTPTAKSGTYTFNVSATNSGGSVTTPMSLTVNKADPTWSGSTEITKTYGDAAFDLGQSINSNGALSYVSETPSVADVDLSGNVTIKKKGTTVVTVNAAATDYYNSASRNVTVTVNPTKPLAPTNTRAEIDGFGSVKLYWDESTFDGDGLGGLTYNIYYGTTPGYLQKYASNCVSGDVVAGLSAGTTYYFAVTAVNASIIESDQSTTASIETLRAIAYTNKILTPGTAGTEYSQSVAHATDGYGTITYEVAEGSTLPDGLELAEDGTVSGTPTTAGTYYFDITATNEGGSATATMTLAINSTNPASPVIDAISGEDGKVTVTWTAPEFTGGKQITGYYVLRSTDTGEEKEFDIVKQTLANVAQYTDTNVVNGTTYYYQVIAVNADNLQSTPKDTDTKEAKPYRVPDAPVDFTAAPKDKYSIEISWSEPYNGGDDVTGYAIKVYSDEEYQTEITDSVTVGDIKVYSDEEYQTEITDSVTVGDIADNKAVVSGLGKYTTYYFTVTAENRAGTGAEAKTSATTFTNPSEPTGLTPEIASHTAIKLTWTAPEDNGGQEVVSYNVYYREKNTEEWEKIDGIETTEYTVENLTTGTLYEFKVTAMNGTTDDDEGPDSEIVEMIPAKEPAAPVIGELISKNAGAVITSIDVDNNFGNAVKKYIVYTSTDGETFTKHTEIETAYDSSNNILVGDLVNGTEYQIKVSAVNDLGESEMSNAQSIIVGMPLPPKNVKAVPQPGQKIEITYDAADGQGSAITGYDLYIGGTNDGKTCELEKISVDGTSYVYDASNRVNGDTVTVYVVSKSQPQADVLESAASETAIAALGSPSAPEITNLTADDSGIDLAWTEAASNGNSKRYYEVTIVDENGNKLQKFQTTSSSTLSMRIMTEQFAFESGKTYGAYVTCWNTAGEGPASNTWMFTFGAPQAPEVEEPVMGDKELTVKWSKPQNNGGAEIIGYNIYLNDETDATMYVTWHNDTAPYQLYITDYRGNNGEVAYGTGQDNLDSFEVVIGGLANGFAYSVRVTAVNANGEGPSKEIDEPVTPATKPSIPRDIVGSATSASDISVTWNKPYSNGGSAVTGYFVEVTKTGVKNYDTGDYDDVERESAWSGTISTGTSTEVSGLEAGSRYEVTVAAITAAGQGESGTATVCTHSRPSKPIITELISGVGDTETLPLTVRWKAPEDDGDSPIIGYDVYINGTYKMNLDGLISADATEYVINDVRIKRGTTYSVTVIAYNAVTGALKANGVSSDAMSITLGTIPAPKDIKVTGDTLGNLYVSWPLEQYTGIEQYIDRYMIYVNDAAVTSTKSNDVTLTLRPMGEPQKVQVSVISTFMQEGLKSEPVTITIGAPDAVTNVIAQPAENGAVVTWNEVTPPSADYPITSYNVYVDGEAVQTINPSEAEELKAELTGLTAGKEYEINVTAVNDNGESVMGDAVKVTPYAKPDAPIVKDIKPGVGSFSFTFDEPNGNGAEITGYKVFVDGSEAQAAIAGNTVIVAGVTDGEVHEFYIIAENDKGLSSDAPAEPYDVITGVPSAPENPVVVPGDGSAEITVDKPEDVDPEHPTTGYKVLDNGVPMDPQPEIIETEDGKLIVKIEPIDNGAEHSITIRPINDIGEGQESDPVVVVSGIPQAPEISNITPGNAKLSIEWTEPAENAGRITMYTVYVNGSLALTTPITSAEVTDLTNGVPYVITVSATNYVGEGVMSQAESGIPGAVPGSVENITFEKGYEDGSCSVTLKWDAPTDNGGLPITGYAVEGDGTIEVDSVNRTAVITGLNKGTEYTFTVSAVNNAGNGEAVTTDAIRTLSEPSAPMLVEANGANRRIDASWTASTDSEIPITGFVLYAEPVYGGETIRNEVPVIESENGEYTGSITEGLQVGSKYNVSVAAVNIVGEGSKSSPTRITVTEEIVATVPGAPTEFTVTPGDGSVQISWKAPNYDGNSSITKYCIWRGPSPDDIGPWAEVDGYTFSYTDTGLKNGTTYYYKVKAINAVSVVGGPFTETLSATPTKVTPPSKPTWVTFDNETGISAYEVNAQGNAITIRWNESTGDEQFGAISYKVYVNGELKTTTTDLSYVLTNPEEGVQYNIQVKAVNDKGAETSSDFIRAYRSLNIRKGSAEDGFTYPTQYADGIYAYIDANYDGYEDNEITPTKPSAPQNFNVTTDELNTKVILTWSEPLSNGNANITKYNVYVDGTINTLAASDIVLEDGSYKYSYSLTGSATVHSFYVTAVNEQNLEGDSTPIKYAPISYEPTPVLPAPTDFGYAVANKTDIVLSWTAVDGADSYVLYTNGMPKTLTVDDITIDGTTVSYTYPGEINMTYTFMVSAKSGTTESAVSASVYADTHETPAEAPLNLKLTPGESSIVVTWDAPSNIDEADVLGYIVYINGDHVYELTDASGKIEYTTSECTYTIDELKTVYVKVAAISNHGTVGAISDTQEYIYNPALDPDTPPMPIIDISGYEFFYSEIDGILLKENNLKFTWTAGNPVPGEHEADTVSYNVFVDGVQVAEKIAGLEYTCTVTAGKDSLIEVQSVAENGKTGPKAPLNVEVPENEYPLPDKVEDLTADLSEDNKTVTLTWTESSDTDTDYYLVVNGTQQTGTVNTGYEYTLDSSVKNYIFMLKSAKTYSDGTEVTVDSNEATVTVPITDPEEPVDPPNYESNPVEFVQYISDGVSSVKIFWNAPEPKENETGTITEYQVYVDTAYAGTVSATDTLVYEITGFSSITDKKDVVVKAYKDISGSLILASTSAKATVSPYCNIVADSGDYENPVLPVDVTNADTNFTGVPTVSEEKIPIPVRPVSPISGIGMKLVDEYGNEIYADVEEGDSEFNAKFPADKMQGNTYSIVVSKEGYTSYTVTGISKEDLASVELNKVELYVGDLNGNGVINFEDKSILSGNLNSKSGIITITMGDLNGNGAINFEDKAILTSNMDKSNVSKSWADIK